MPVSSAPSPSQAIPDDLVVVAAHRLLNRLSVISGAVAMITSPAEAVPSDNEELLDVIQENVGVLSEFFVGLVRRHPVEVVVAALR